MEGCFELPLFSDITSDLSGSNDSPVFVFNRRDGEGDVKPSPIFGHAHGFKMVDSVAGLYFRQDFRFIILQLRGDDESDGLTDDLFGFVTKNALCRAIPAHDNSAQVLADDGI